MLLLDQKPERHRRIGAAGLAAKKYGIGQPSSCGRFVNYRPKDYQKAGRLLGIEPVNARVLAAANEGAKAHCDRGPWPSHDAAVAERRLRTDIRGSLVAARPIGLGEQAEWPAHFITLNWQQAAAMSMDVLVLCQRMETLLELQQFAWLSKCLRGRRALAVYAGDMQTFYRETSVKRMLEAVDLPVLGLFDWDPRSLIRAMAISRFEAFCWPPRLKQCQVQAVPASFAALSRRYKPQLNSLQAAPLVATWKEFQTVGKVWSTLDFMHCS